MRVSVSLGCIPKSEISPTNCTDTFKTFEAHCQIALQQDLYSLYEPMFSDNVVCSYGFSIKIANIIEVLSFMRHCFKYLAFI